MVTTRSKNNGEQVFLSLGPNKRFRPMIAASYTRNHIYGFRENDIKNLMYTYYYHTQTNHIRNQKGLNNINSYRKKRGLEFEKKIFDNWENDSTIKLKSYDDLKWTNDNCKIGKKDIIDKYYDLLKHIPIVNPYNRVGGIPDILIRSDKIKDILKLDYPFLYEPIHYVLVEIKYSNQITKYHRNQLYCYNNALKHIQNYEPKCAFVLNKNISTEMIVFTQEDKDRYEQSTRWYRKIKKIKTTINSNSKIDKTILCKKLRFVPKIRIPKYLISNNYMDSDIKSTIDYTKNFIYYIFILDIDISAFFITDSKPIIWHVAILRKDNRHTDKLPVFIKYFGNTFSSVETYKSVNFIYHNLVPNSDVVLCSKINPNWDWINKDWKNIYHMVGNILDQPNMFNNDQLSVIAWDFINTHNMGSLEKIELNSKIFLNKISNIIHNNNN